MTRVEGYNLWGVFVFFFSITLRESHSICVYTYWQFSFIGAEGVGTVELFVPSTFQNRERPW